MKTSVDFSAMNHLFSELASTYDQANDRMTFGLVRRWRRELVRWSYAKPNADILDCATGTGDLAIDFRAALGSDAHITGLDACENMLAIARKKTDQRNVDISYIQGDVLALPFNDCSFDVVSIGYGLRNVVDPERALCEMSRMLRPGGVLLILETGNPSYSLFPFFLRFYIRHVVPLLGGSPSGKRAAYRYLSASTLSFPAGPEMLHLMRSAIPNATIEFKRLFGGASYLYRARC